MTRDGADGVVASASAAVTHVVHITDDVVHAGVLQQQRRESIQCSDVDSAFDWQHPRAVVVVVDSSDAQLPLVADASRCAVREPNAAAGAECRRERARDHVDGHHICAERYAATDAHAIADRERGRHWW